MSASFGKREREKKKQERAAEKRERRQDRNAQSESEDRPDDTALMERFRVISEAFEAKTMTREAYEAERSAIFAELGVGDSLS